MVNVDPDFLTDLFNALESSGRAKYSYLFDRLLDEHVPLDPRKDRVSRSSLVTTTSEIVHESSNCADPIDTFEERLTAYVRDVKKRPLTEFQVAFRLPVSFDSSYLTDAQVQGANLSLLLNPRWEEYVDEAMENDNVQRFDLDSSTGLNSRLGLSWETTMDAKDPRYAAERAYEIINVFASRLNFAKFGGKVRFPRYNREERLKRFSELRVPNIVLVFSGGEFEDYHSVDLNYRASESINWNDREVRRRFHLVPNISAAPSGLEVNMVGALWAYQAGMTNPSDRRGFFDFWRGIENLALLERDESKEEAIRRAKFAFQASSYEARETVVEDLFDRLFESRNALVHEGVHIDVSRQDREHAKILLEALLVFYFNHTPKFSRSELKRVFSWATESGKKREKDRAALDVVDELLS